ncbi:MAG: glycosyltransferase family 9 protein [bacterium]|nr:glycosyltransferase family 9 protein [bacterium]
MEQFLICHRGALGDFILTWPALYALRESFPDLQFIGLGRPEYLRLAIRLGLIDTCCDGESSELIEFFSGHSLPPALGSPKGAVLWLAQGQAVSELLKKSASLPVALIPPFPQKRLHVATYHYLAVGSHFPMARSFLPLGLSTPPLPSFSLGGSMSRGEYALIHPGSGSPAKNYSLWLYCELARQLRQQGYSEIRFLLGPAEDEKLEQHLSGELIERPPDVEALAQLQAKAALYIGNDSGASHLAAILGTPTIALYKTTDPDIWGVIGHRAVNLQAQSEGQALLAIRDILMRKQIILSD